MYPHSQQFLGSFDQPAKTRVKLDGDGRSGANGKSNLPFVLRFGTVQLRAMHDEGQSRWGSSLGNWEFFF